MDEALRLSYYIVKCQKPKLEPRSNKYVLVTITYIDTLHKPSNAFKIRYQYPKTKYNAVN